MRLARMKQERTLKNVFSDKFDLKHRLVVNCSLPLGVMKPKVKHGMPDESGMETHRLPCRKGGNKNEELAVIEGIYLIAAISAPM